MKIAIGSDHAGYKLKEKLIAWLSEKNFEAKDFGPFSDDRVDYPDFAHKVSTAIHKKEYEFGILVCGSANGVAMVANKYENVRAAICWAEEIANLARKHNNANIICLPARFITENQGIVMVKLFLNAKFEGGRHEQRVEKINIA